MREAIAGRKPLAFVYSGAARVVHPHRLGVSAAGKTLLRAWEVSKAGALTGGNVPGEPARPACRQTDPAGGQWKLYSLAKFRAPRVLFENAPFPQAPGYTPADKALRTLLAEVPYQAQQPPHKD